jgi:very-short-patch-repair endonuclease
MVVDVQSAAMRLFAACKDEYLAGLWMEISVSADSLAPLCESEIELMLLAAFDVQSSMAGRERFTKIVSQDEVFEFGEETLAVIPQYRWNSYRIDFAVRLKNWDGILFVECDGHDFHERTKEQAERDRSKDREVQAAGIPILRFTGREIYRNPMSCVLQIQKFILGRVQTKGAK